MLPGCGKKTEAGLRTCGRLLETVPPPCPQPLHPLLTPQLQPPPLTRSLRHPSLPAPSRRSGGPPRNPSPSKTPHVRSKSESAAYRNQSTGVKASPPWVAVQDSRNTSPCPSTSHPAGFAERSPSPEPPIGWPTRAPPTESQPSAEVIQLKALTRVSTCEHAERDRAPQEADARCQDVKAASAAAPACSGVRHPCHVHWPSQLPARGQSPGRSLGPSLEGDEATQSRDDADSCSDITSELSSLRQPRPPGDLPCPAESERSQAESQKRKPGQRHDGKDAQSAPSGPRSSRPASCRARLSPPLLLLPRTASPPDWEAAPPQGQLAPPATDECQRSGLTKREKAGGRRSGSLRARPSSSPSWVRPGLGVQQPNPDQGRQVKVSYNRQIREVKKVREVRRVREVSFSSRRAVDATFSTVPSMHQASSEVITPRSEVLDPSKEQRRQSWVNHVTSHASPESISSSSDILHQQPSAHCVGEESSHGDMRSSVEDDSAERDAAQEVCSWRQRHVASHLQYIPEDKESTASEESELSQSLSWNESKSAEAPGVSTVLNEAAPTPELPSEYHLSDSESSHSIGSALHHHALHESSSPASDTKGKVALRQAGAESEAQCSPSCLGRSEPSSRPCSACPQRASKGPGRGQGAPQGTDLEPEKTLPPRRAHHVAGRRLSRSLPAASLALTLSSFSRRRPSSPSLPPPQAQAGTSASCAASTHAQHLGSPGGPRSLATSWCARTFSNLASRGRRNSTCVGGAAPHSGKRAALTRRNTSRELQLQQSSHHASPRLSLKNEIDLLNSVGSLLQRRASSLALRTAALGAGDTVDATSSSSSVSASTPCTQPEPSFPAGTVINSATVLSSARRLLAGSEPGSPQGLTLLPPPCPAPDIAAYLDATLRLFANRPLSPHLYGAPGRAAFLSSRSSSPPSELSEEETAPPDSPTPSQVACQKAPDPPKAPPPSNFPMFPSQAPTGSEQAPALVPVVEQGAGASPRAEADSTPTQASHDAPPSPAPSQAACRERLPGVEASRTTSVSFSSDRASSTQDSQHALVENDSHLSLTPARTLVSDDMSTVTSTASPSLPASVSAVESTCNASPLRPRPYRFARSTSAPSLGLVHPDPPPPPQRRSARGKMATMKMPRFTGLQFFRKRQTLDSLSLERPQSLQSVYESVREALLGVEERLAMLELSFYGPGRTVDHEVKQWLPGLESVMAAARCSRLLSQDQLLQVVEKHYDVTDKFHVNESSLEQAMEAVDKILLTVNDGFADLISAVEKVLTYMNKYVLSFSTAEGDPYMETATNYEKQRRELRTAVLLNLKNIALMVEKFRTDGLAIQHFDYVIKEIAERCGCAHVPILVMFPAACHNVRNACTGIRKWIEADDSYATYLQYDIAELEKKREVQGRRTRELAIKASNAEHKLKAVRREVTEIGTDIKRLEHKEQALRREEAEASAQQQSVKVELEIKELRRDEFRRFKDRLPSREQNERYDRLVSEIAALRDRKTSLDRKMEEFKRKTEWFAERRYRMDDTEKMLEDMKVEHKKAKLVARQAEVELERLDTCVAKLKDIILLKTSPETLKKIFHHMPYASKLQTHKKRGADKLERACTTVAAWIEGDWMKLYRALPFHPPRGEETISMDIDDIVQTQLRHTLRQHARQALSRWRRMHTRANVDDLKMALLDIRRRDVWEKLQECFTPRTKRSPDPRPYRTVHFPKVSLHAH